MAISKGPLHAVLGSSAAGLKPHFHHCPARSFSVITKETAERVQVLASRVEQERARRQLWRFKQEENPCPSTLPLSLEMDFIKAEKDRRRCQVRCNQVVSPGLQSCGYLHQLAGAAKSKSCFSCRMGRSIRLEKLQEKLQ